MQLLAHRISALKIGWNKFALGECDFFALCQRFGVTIIEEKLATPGFYYRLLGRDFIVVDLNSLVRIDCWSSFMS